MIEHTNADLEQAIVESIKPARGRRFLAAQARAGNGLGYLSRPSREVPDVAPGASVAAVRAQEVPADVAERIGAATSIFDEPEAVGPAVVDAQADLARHYSRLRHAAEVESAIEARKLLSLEARMADARRRAKIHHVDVSHGLHLVTKALDRARPAARGAVPETAAELRAAKAERGVEPVAAIRRMEAVEARLDAAAAPS